MTSEDISKDRQQLESLCHEARKRASESPYHGCATAVFTTVVDTLHVKYGDETFRAMIGICRRCWAPHKGDLRGLERSSRSYQPKLS